MHVMLDVETLGVRTSSIILSIGAVWFDPDTMDLFEEFDVVLHKDQQRALGRTVDESTIDWWQKQSSEARARVFPANDGADCIESLKLLNEFFLVHSLDGLWGNGAMFDNALIGSLYNSFGVHSPVPYNRNFCFRTLRMMYRAYFPLVPDPAFKGVAHNALDDAKYQAECAMDYLRRLNCKLAAL